MKAVLASAFVLGATLVQGANHVINVAPGGKLVYDPNDVVAAVGDTLEFRFSVGNHSVAQSSFAAPCTPLDNSVWSGFEFISAPPPAGASSPAAAATTGSNSYGYVKREAGTVKTFTVTVNNTSPLWFYCAQAKHCQSGMSMVVNVNNASNKTLAAYQAAASKVAINGVPTFAPEGGVQGTVAGSTTGSVTTSTSKPSSGATKIGFAGGFAGSAALALVVLGAIGGFMTI